jgi:hypothetical protein
MFLCGASIMISLVTSFMIPVGIHHAWARSFRVSQVPHGATFSCRTCHLGAMGGAINSFGYDVSLRLVGGNADWPALCALDSDEDGFSNAEELGDPDCTWREGDRAPNVSPTAPGDPGSFPQPVVPDMMREDMSPPIDFAPPPDAAPPVDMFIDVWDAAMYDWSQQDIFMTTDESWIAPDMEGRLDMSVDMSVDISADATSAIDLNMTSATEPDEGLVMGGDEMPNNQSGAKSRDQSGCYVSQSSRTHRSNPLWLSLVVFIGWRARRRLTSE